MKDFLADLTWNAAGAALSIAAPYVLSKLLANSTDEIPELGRAAQIISDVEPNDVVNKFTIRHFGTAISESELATKVLGRMQYNGISIKLDFKTRPISSEGYPLGGEATPYLYRIDIYMQNQSSAKSAVSTLVHESSHIDRGLRGIPQTTRYEEYVAFRREFLYNKGRRPTLQERRNIWQAVNELYTDLEVGKSPF
jgi:hypothetical protein